MDLWPVHVSRVVWIKKKACVRAACGRQVDGQMEREGRRIGGVPHCSRSTRPMMDERRERAGRVRPRAAGPCASTQNGNKGVTFFCEIIRASLTDPL